MKFPAVRGIIDRRILVNYRVDRLVLERLLPLPFRPKLVKGWGIVGICLIRLTKVHPWFLPSWMGFGSENAAHRAAVEWDESGDRREGVYVRRRDTNVWLNTLVGGRLFPGLHDHARFSVNEDGDRFCIDVASDDGDTKIHVDGRQTAEWPTTSLFSSLQEASTFFETGSVGYSATRDPRRFDGLKLNCNQWRVDPIAISEVRSNYFDNRSIFPAGAIELDGCLLMRGIDHEWRGEPELCCTATASH